MASIIKPVSYIYQPETIPNPNYMGVFDSPDKLPATASEDAFADVTSTNTEWGWNAVDNQWQDTNSAIGTTNHSVDNVDYDPRQDKIISFYKTFGDVKDEEPNDKLWQTIWLVARQLSLATCWGEEQDDLFLVQTRTQVINISATENCCPKCCSCGKGIVKINLLWLPLHGSPDVFVGGRISAVVDGKPVVQSIGYEYLNEHFDPDTGAVYLRDNDFPILKGDCQCWCDIKLTITLQYNSGYEYIPVDLMQLFHKLSEQIASSAGPNCTNAMTQVSGLLTRKKTTAAEYQWSEKNTPEQDLQKVYSDIALLGSMNAVMAISRCDVSYIEPKMGDVV